jgi:hypothetical protein
MMATRIIRSKVALWAVLGIVLGFGFVIRIYALTAPPLDFHPTRQLRSAIIARSFYYQIDPAVSQDERDKAGVLASLEAYEPPILEGLVAGTYYLMGGEHLWVVRIWNAVFWLIGGLVLFALTRRFVSPYAAILGLCFFLFLPFSVFATRSFQPDTLMVVSILLTVYALVRWIETPSWKWTLLVGVFGGMAVIFKPVAAPFIGGLLCVVPFAVSRPRDILRQPRYWLIVTIVVAPSVIYYLLLNSERSQDFYTYYTLSLSKYLLDHTFYSKWLAMIRGLMGNTIFMAALLGVVIAPPRFRTILCGLWAGYAMLGMIFPYQYVSHDYYHLPLVALVGVSLPMFLEYLIKKLTEQRWYWQALSVGIFVFASGYSLWVARSVIFVHESTLEPASWRNVGEAMAPNGPTVGLVSDYGMRLRYYGGRMLTNVWPIVGELNVAAYRGDDPIEYQAFFDDITEGADYFLVTSFTELENQPQLKEILTTYSLYYEGNGFIIYDLKAPLQGQ